MALATVIPLPAHAFDFSYPTDTFNVCPQYDGFTKRIVACLRGTILNAASTFLAPFFAYMYGILAICTTLAVAFWGVQMATGHSHFSIRSGYVLAMKIGVLIMLFTGAAFNFQYFFEGVLDSIESLLSLVTGYVDFSPSFAASCPPGTGDPTPPALAIWDRVDCVFDTLIGGVLPVSTIASGIAGFFLASLLSGAAGLFIGFLGFTLILQLLFAIFRAVYIFIMAYLAISVMAIIAPIFLPLMLFRVTMAYFEKWVKLTIGFALQPIFLFVFLAMLLAAYDSVVYTGPISLYRALAGDEVDSNPNFRIGDWLRGNGAYAENVQGDYAVNIDSEHAAPQGIEDIQTGVAGRVGEAATQSSDWDKNLWKATGASNIHEYLGLKQFFFHVDMPTEVVDWEWMAVLNDYYPPNMACSDPDEQADGLCTGDYVADVLLALIMAVAVAYIFMLILDFLPFIGIGVVGDVLATPTFGVGALAPPGEGMFRSIRSKLMGGS